jgi:hypothetical protein
MSFMHRSLVTGALLCCSVPAIACDPQISRVDGPVNDSYEPFSPDAATYPLNITITNRGEAACDLRAVAIGTVSGARRLIGSSSREQLGYEIFGDQAIRLPNEQAPGFGIPILVAGRQEIVLRLQVRVRPGQVVPSGHYDENVELLLLDRTGEVREQRRFPLSVRVEARAQVNLAGTAGVFSSGARSAILDLGEMKDGTSNAIFIQLRANEPVRVKLHSQNRGELINVGQPDERIPYELVVDGTPVDLSAPATLRRAPPRSLDGASYRAIATVPVVGNRFAGEYRDLIAVSVEAAP